MRLRSLAVTLTMAFLGQSAIIMIIISVINIHNVFVNNEKLVFEQQQNIAIDAANQVEKFISEKVVILSSVSHVTNMSAIDNSTQKQVIGKVLALDSAFRQIALIDKNNNEVGRVSRLASSTSGQLNVDNIKEALNEMNDEIYISRVYCDDSTFEPIIIMAVPVLNSLGDKDGVVFAEINLKFMWELIDTIKVGKNGFAYVTDREGNLIAFNDEGRVISGEKIDGLNIVKDFIGSNGINAQKTAKMTKGIMGTNVVTTYVPLGKPDWAVFIEIPVIEAAEPIIRNIIISIISMLIGFILAAIIGIYLSKRITKPIINLKSAARLISKGELGTEIKINAKNEIGELAVDFNQMADNINTLIMNIKQASRIILEQSSTLKEKSDLSAQSSETIVCAMEQINQGADQQAKEAEATSEQTGILGEEINNAVNKTAEVERLAGSARDLSLKSKDTVEILIERANETDRITRAFVENTTSLSDSLEKIRSIADAITEITNKTKNLSLNARIEAARAGEAGRGFEVIVKEISNLSNQSREAAKLIDPILEEIKLKAAVSSKASEEVNVILEEQMKSVYSTQDTFDKIILSMDNAISQIVELSNIIRNIDGIKEKSIKSVMTISSVTQQTAASCQEVSAASEEQKEIAYQVKSFADKLYEMGEKLVEVIDAFKTREEENI
ncbi:MAG TPA: methyl-accepting chemotaxis protein [Pseudobacteroides sp.]|nr:methyl-accepting chemotaxis protein [Pseudobacteroides sp.]